MITDPPMTCHDDSSRPHALSRRDLLVRGLGCAAGLGLAGGLRADPPVADPPLPAGKARSLIQIWLWGGPSHLDTFDPKPEAGPDFCGPYDTPIETAVDGLRYCQMLPLLARQADKVATLRGLTHGQNGHETAAYLVQDGRPQGEKLVWPGVGAVVTHFRRAALKDGLLPPYITLTQTQGRFSESGFLGSAYKPFATGGDPNKDPFAVEGVVSETVDEPRQRRRRELLGELDALAKERPENPLVKDIGANQERAYELILGEAGKVFDLRQEPDAVRDRYGRHRLGQSCLVARRLVEQGVPMITVNARGWDTHKNHFPSMSRMLPQLDSAVANLLEDLAARGLLDSTIVWVSGEFGRTPRIQQEPPWNGGRGHYGKAFSALVAGGGFKGGTVLGATDERGETVTERPVWPWDLLGSFYRLLGIAPDATLPGPEDTRVPVSPLAVEGLVKPEQTGGLLTEIS